MGDHDCKISSQRERDFGGCVVIRLLMCAENEHPVFFAVVRFKMYI